MKEVSRRAFLLACAGAPLAAASARYLIPPGDIDKYVLGILRRTPMVFPMKFSVWEVSPDDVWTEIPDTWKPRERCGCSAMYENQE